MAAILLGTVVPAQVPASGRTILVKAARIIDGRGGPPLANGGVLIRGDRIERIGPAAGLTADQVIDLGSATVLPGLIDLHTHLTDEVGTNWESALLTTTPGRAAIYGAVNARTTLMAGFTTCRDMGPTWPYVDIDLRYAIDKGSVPGPRLQVAGNYVSATGGAGDARQFSIYVDVPIVRNLADGVDQVRQVVRTNLKNGADFIKILATGAVMSKGIPPGAQQYSDAELAVAVEEAARWGRFVAAHAHGTEGIKAALRAGVRTIDHGSMLDEEAARLLKEKGAYFAPTLYVGHTILNDNQALNIPAHQVERERAMQGTQERAFKIALAQGLPIAFATDAGVFPHGENAREFKLRVGLGQSPMAAIEGATRIAAEAMGWADRVGTLQPGLLRRSHRRGRQSTADISELERVPFVMKGGVVYQQVTARVHAWRASRRSSDGGNGPRPQVAVDDRDDSPPPVNAMRPREYHPYRGWQRRHDWSRQSPRCLPFDSVSSSRSPSATKRPSADHARVATIRGARSASSPAGSKVFESRSVRRRSTPPEARVPSLGLNATAKIDRSLSAKCTSRPDDASQMRRSDSALTLATSVVPGRTARSCSSVR